MKYLIPLFLISSANAATLTLDSYDQMKLANFLGKLSLAKTEVEEVNGIRRVHAKLSRLAMSIKCASDFYSGAAAPSFVNCSLDIDDNHPSLEKHYDEWKIVDNSADVASSLFAIMPYGADVKTFRSGFWEQGTDFNGRRTNIFDFIFECSKTACNYRFAEKKIK